ncbi:MAG: methionyl-tRNA formyltransferase [Flavobacteriales bacterium]|nr:methionyl-tRNA formyltransferase [Flavobacteriales bacterium]
MKIVFFGTPAFAASNLEFLHKKGIEISAVVSAPDKQKGRGKKIIPTAVKVKANDLGINVLTPFSLKDETFISELKSIDANLFVVVAFRMLPKEIWKIPKMGTINLHTSLLPNYRGAAPINRVLINGETETGITTFFIDGEIDCGKMLEQEKVNLSGNTTAAQLHNLLREKGSDLLLKTIDKIKNQITKTIIQNSDLAISEAPKLTKELSKINWEINAKEIHNLIRGLSPILSENEILKEVSICPSAWFNFKVNDKEIRTKLLLSKFSDKTNNKIGKIETDNKTYLKINLKKGSIFIEKLQIAGKNAVNISQFLLGNKVDGSWTVS